MKFSLHNLWEFIKLLKIEIYFFLVFFCLNLQIVTNTQLMEDKLCFNELKYSPEFCLATDASEVFSDQRKYILLEETTSLNNYRTIIEVVPSMFLALFGGYWIDSYPGHLKLILSLPVIAEITKMIILIINCIYFPSNAYLLLTSFPLCAFLGTGYACITGVNTYIAWTTPPKLRFVRFAVVELCLTLVNLLGSLVGGYVLTMKPWFKGQPANYMGVYIIGLTSMVLAQMWLLIMVPSLKMPEEVERKPSSSEVAPTDSHPALAAHAARTSSINGTVASTSTEQPTKSLSFFGKMVDVFNFSTVSKVFKTINKKRPDGGRSMVICLVVSMMLFRAADFGEAGCDFQFSQRAYGWNPRSYSVFYAIFHLPPALVTLVLPPILNRHFKLADTTVGIIACISFFGQYFLRGTILSSSGYFISYTVGSLHRMCPAALRSLLCKLVDPHEMGEIFSIFTAMEAFIRLFESTIYTAVFNASIDEYPGLVFHIMGATGFFIYIVFMWIDLRLRRISREKRQTEISRIAAAFGNCPADQIKPVNSPPDSLNNSTSHLTPPKLPTIDEQGISNPAYGSSLETSTISMKR